jgi:multiple sugar transport system permease protein
VYSYSQAFYLAFVKYKFTEPQTLGKFIGLTNFIDVMEATYFMNTIYETFVFTFMCTFVIVILGIGISILLNEKFKGVGFVRFIILIPWALPPAAAGLIWRLMLYGSGWINRFAITLGILKEPIVFLGMGRMYQLLYALIAQMWQQLPFASILLMAAHQLIPTDLLDAAKVDGASWVKRLRHVTFPYIRNVVALVAIWEAIVAFTSYDILYTFSGGTWGILTYYVLAEGFNWLNLGHAAALSVIIAIFILIMIGIVLLIIPPKKIYEYSFVE